VYSDGMFGPRSPSRRSSYAGSEPIRYANAQVPDHVAGFVTSTPTVSDSRCDGDPDRGGG
jgi:hypothetical protein